MGFYDDAEKLDYPAADRLVADYLAETDRERTTSVAVLRSSDYPNTHHNRLRVHDALAQVCAETEENWAGRTVFAIPDSLEGQP